MSLLESCKSLLGRLIQLDIYTIWTNPQDPALPTDRSTDPDVAIRRAGIDISPSTIDAASLLGHDHLTYSYHLKGALACRATVRPGAAYERATLDLRIDEAKLVDIITVPEYRGRGIAPSLIQHIALDLDRHGMSRIYARIWHRNHASRRAFEKAGWNQIGIVCFVHAPMLAHLSWTDQMVRFSCFFSSRANHPVRSSFSRVGVALRSLEHKY